MINQHNQYLDPAYETAVNNFIWPTVDFKLAPAFLPELKEITEEIANKIRLSSNIRHYIGRNLSLRKVCFLAVQSQDIKEGIKNTASKIDNATKEQKIILSYIFRRLSEIFILLDEEDLKAETLIFGIHSVHPYGVYQTPAFQ